MNSICYGCYEETECTWRSLRWKWMWLCLQSLSSHYYSHWAQKQQWRKLLRLPKPAHRFHFAFTPSSSWLCSSADSCDSSFPLIAQFWLVQMAPIQTLGASQSRKPQHSFSQSSDATLHDITAWGMNWHNSGVCKVTRLTGNDWVV